MDEGVVFDAEVAAFEEGGTLEALYNEDSGNSGSEADDDGDDFVPDDDVGKGPSGPPPLRYDYATQGNAPVHFPGVPSRHELIMMTDQGKMLHHETVEKLTNREEVMFMPWDVNESTYFPRRAPGSAWGQKSTPRYQLNLIGHLPDGSKTHLVINDAPVYFGIWLPTELSPDVEHQADVLSEDETRWIYTTQGLMQEHGIERYEVGLAYPLRGYRKHPRRFIRLFFPSLANRKKAIGVARNHSLETFSDDRSNYFRLLARENHLPMCSWIKVNNYGLQTGGAAQAGSMAGSRLPIPDASDKSPLCSYYMSVSLKDLKALSNPLEPDEDAEAMIANTPFLSRENSFVMTFDIETHSPDRGEGTPPTATKPHDVVFMLAASIHLRSDPKPLAKVVLCTQETAPDSRWTTIICGNGGSDTNEYRPNTSFGQDSLVMAFAEVFKLWAPEVITGFNDGQYDWPFMIETARQQGVLTPMVERMSAVPRYKLNDKTILQWYYQMDRMIKISAEKRHDVSYLKVPGCVPVDARVAYMRLYPKNDKTSLNAFLDKVKLGGKVDMPYTRMWKIYEESVRAHDSAAANYMDSMRAQTPEAVMKCRMKTQVLGQKMQDAAEQMRHVAHYCFIDAIRCQELLTKRNVIQNNREMGNYSFTSFNDCVFLAGGHKVCNMLFAYCVSSSKLLGFPIYGSMIAEKTDLEGKYPGAYVVFPEKGLEEDLPITGLDFSSLYPSLIRTYNLSLEKFLNSEEEAQAAEAQGEKVHRVDFMFGSHRIQGWFIQHQNTPEKVGVYARALADLYEKRAGMKKVLKPLEAEIEQLEAIFGDFRKETKKGHAGFCRFYYAALAKLESDIVKFEAESKGPVDDETKQDLKKKIKNSKARAKEMKAFLAQHQEKMQTMNESQADRHIFEELEIYLADLEFRFVGVDSKQKAVKVFMNTFYGEAGNKNSALFYLPLAGGVTSAGKYNLMLVKKFVEKEGFGIKYGDTDSLYLSCPPECYAEVENEYRQALEALGINLRDIPGGPENLFRPLMTGDAWDLQKERIQHDREASTEHYQGVYRKVESLAELPMDDPNFVSVHADLAEELKEAWFQHQKEMEDLDRKDKELGERPQVTDDLIRAKNSWLSTIFAQRPDLKEPIEAAYEKMCIAKVKITMKVMSDIQAKVNAHLESDNGTKILKMAYEEVLHPVTFTGKKKYFGIAHINRPNYNIEGPKKIFVRGIDVVKQGQTRLAKEIGLQCMWDATRLHPPGSRTPLIERVENVIRRNCSELHNFRASDQGAGGGWKFEDFVQTDAWKPDKDNKSVQKFMRRMRVRHKMQLSENEIRKRKKLKPVELDYIEPEPGSRFPYILVEAPRSFDLRGYVKKNDTKGDLMEYVHVAKKKNSKINVSYYLKNYVVGLCARFINYEKRFELQDSFADDKQKDEHAQKKAKKHLSDLIKSLVKQDNSVTQKRGRAYKKAYATVAERACASLYDSLGSCASLLVGDVTGADLGGKDNAEAKASKGQIDYELFLPDEDEGVEMVGDDDSDIVNPSEMRVPLAEKCRAAALQHAKKVLGEFEEPTPVWNPELNHGRGGYGQREQGITDRMIEKFGVSSKTEGREALYRYVNVLRAPSRQAMMRKGLNPNDHPANVHDRFFNSIEAEAYATIEENSQIVTEISSRIRDSLEGMVQIERTVQHKLHPEELGTDFEGAVQSTDDEGVDATSPEFIEQSMRMASSALNCTDAERAVLQEVNAAWWQMVGVAFQRQLRQNLLTRLATLKTKAL